MFLFNLLIVIGLSRGEKTKSSFLKSNGLFGLVSEHRYRLPYGRITFPDDRMAGVHIHADGYSKLSAARRGNMMHISRFARPFWWPQDVSFCDTVLLHSFNEYLEKSQIDLDDFEYITFPHILETEKRLDGHVSECVCRIKFGLKIGFLPFPFGDLDKTVEDAPSYCQEYITRSPDSFSEFERVDSIQYDMHSVAPVADSIKSLIPDMDVQIIKVNKDDAYLLKSPIQLINGIPMPTVYENASEGLGWNFVVNEPIQLKLDVFKTIVGSLLKKFTGTEELQSLVKDYDGHWINQWWMYGGGNGPDLIPDIVPVMPVRDLYEYDVLLSYQMDGFGSVSLRISPSDKVVISQFEYWEPAYASCPTLFAFIVRKALETLRRSTRTVRSIQLDLRMLDPIRFVDQFKCVLKGALMFGLGYFDLTGADGSVDTFETEDDIDRWTDERFRIHYNVYSRKWMPTVRLFRSGESVIDQITPPPNVLTRLPRKHILLHPKESVAEEVRRIRAGYLTVYDAVKEKYSQIDDHLGAEGVLTEQFESVIVALFAVDEELGTEYSRTVDSLNLIRA